MLALEPAAFPILEGASGTYTAPLVGNDGVTPLSNITLQTLTATFYVIKTDGTLGYIRGTAQAAQDILNTNNVTVTAGGLISWSVQPADTALVEALAYERHIMLFEWTWPGGAGETENVL